MSESRTFSEDVLVLTPTFNDSTMAVEVLRAAGFRAEAFETLTDLCRRARQDSGAIVVAEEALTVDEVAGFQSILETQEAWSDLPIILLTNGNVMAATELFAKGGNVSLLERPFSRMTLIRSVEVALRARRKQYEVRMLLAQQRLATEKRDEFFATLSHELRTPLNVMLGWLEIIRGGKLDAKGYNDALETLERNSKMQQALIEDLLDISRIVTGKMQFEFASISFSDLVRSAVNSFLPRAELKGVSLELKEPAERFPVMGDEQRLSQAVNNLVMNSIKFTPPGGKVLVSIARAGNAYALTVADTGQGVDPSFLPFMFDRLKQEDMSTTRSHSGLGLGLAIVSHIVGEHHGTISAESEGRGRGMKITLTLAAAARDAISIRQPIVASHGLSLKGIRVLVVDDSPDILKLIQMWLSAAEAEVRLTSSGEEALREIRSRTPDVLLSDIGMPDMDGYQLISRIRSMSNRALREVPAVALTAYARDEERLRAISAGFQVHISKPIVGHQLVRAIASLVSPATLH